MNKIIEEFCNGHEVLVAPLESDRNLVLVTILKNTGINDLIRLIEQHNIPDNPTYGVRYGENEEVRIVE